MKITEFWTKMALLIMTPITRLKYGYIGKKYDIKTPFVLISNHVSNWDPLYVLCSMRKPIHYLATDTITNIPIFGKMVLRAFEPVPVDKADVDIEAIRILKKYASAGECIGFFPEGNRSFDGSMVTIKPSTAKLIKMLDYTLDSIMEDELQRGTFTPETLNSESVSYINVTASMF